MVNAGKAALMVYFINFEIQLSISLFLNVR